MRRTQRLDSRHRMSHTAQSKVKAISETLVSQKQSTECAQQVRNETDQRKLDSRSKSIVRAKCTPQQCWEMRSLYRSLKRFPTCPKNSWCAPSNVGIVETLFIRVPPARFNIKRKGKTCGHPRTLNKAYGQLEGSLFPVPARQAYLFIS